MLLQIREFVFPEAKRSLKLYFDNVRNYAICGALLVFDLWLYAQWIALASAGQMQFTLGSIAVRLEGVELLVSIFTVSGVLVVLLFLNAIQSWFLLLYPLAVRIAGADPFAAPTDPKSVQNSPDRPLRVVLVASIVLGLVGYLVVQLSLTVFALASAFVTK